MIHIFTNNFLQLKFELYIKYFKDINLVDKIFDDTTKCKYELDIYLKLYILFENSGISYDTFYEILKLGTLIEHNKYPKKTCLYEFKKKFIILILKIK